MSTPVSNDASDRGENPPDEDSSLTQQQQQDQSSTTYSSGPRGQRRRSRSDKKKDNDKKKKDSRKDKKGRRHSVPPLRTSTTAEVDVIDPTATNITTTEDDNEAKSSSSPKPSSTADPGGNQTNRAEPPADDAGQSSGVHTCDEPLPSSIPPNEAASNNDQASMPYVDSDDRNSNEVATYTISQTTGYVDLTLPQRDTNASNNADGAPTALTGNTHHDSGDTRFLITEITNRNPAIGEQLDAAQRQIVAATSTTDEPKSSRFGRLVGSI